MVGQKIELVLMVTAFESKSALVCQVNAVSATTAYTGH